MVTASAVAQKKELSEAKTYIKSGKNLDKAETLLRKVIAMPEQAVKVDNHVLLADVMRKQYEQSNEKLYLRQLSDTAKIFPLLIRMFQTYETLDSVDALPDKKGRVDIRYRKKNGEYLNTFRPNLFQGTIFSMRQKKYQEALNCVDAYMECHRQPLFAQFNYAETDTLRFKAAYWGVMAARQLCNYDAIARYEDMAQQYEQRAPHVVSVLYEAYLQKGDTAKAVGFLRRGFSKYSEHPFFFPRLVDYYSSRNQIDTVKAIVDRALELEPGNQFYRMARNTVQLNMGEYDNCIILGDSLLHTNDKMSVAYLNVGSAYFNKALLREKQGKESKKKRKEVNAFYEKAMPYLEKFRQLRPKSQERWAPMLYTIYLNLNQGEKFDEIDNLIKSHK